MTNLNQNLKAIIIVLAGAVIALALVAAGLAKAPATPQDINQQDQEAETLLELHATKAGIDCRKALEEHPTFKEVYGFFNEDGKMTGFNPEMTTTATADAELRTYSSKGEVGVKYLGDAEFKLPYRCSVTMYQDGTVAGVTYEID